MSDDLRTLIQSCLDRRDRERLEAAKRRYPARAREEEAQRQREAAKRAKLRDAIRNARLLDYVLELTAPDDAVEYIGLHNVSEDRFAVLKAWAYQRQFHLKKLLSKAARSGAHVRIITGELGSREACIDAMLDEYGLEPVDWMVE